MAEGAVAVDVKTNSSATADGTAGGGYVQFAPQHFGTQSDTVKYAAIAAVVLIALVFFKRKR